MHVPHIEDAAPAPAEDYGKVQPQLDFDTEANIARNNAPNVSTTHFVFSFAHFSLVFVVNIFATGECRVAHHWSTSHALNRHILAIACTVV